MSNLYANQITVAIGEKEVFLRFACLAPSFDKDGKLGTTDVSAEQTIILSKDGFEKLKELIYGMEKVDSGANT